MGYFLEPTTKRITLTDGEHWVELKDEASYGDVKKIGAAQTSESGELLLPADRMLLGFITTWNLDDASGEVVEVTLDNINRLSVEDAKLLINECDSKLEVVNDTEEKKSSSNQ
jgi:hypothetical protein